MCILPWLTDVGGRSEQIAVIDDAWLFNFVCNAVEIVARLCKYIPSLPSDARIRTLREVKHPLIHAYRGKLVNNWKTDGANFCFSYLSAALQFHITGKGSEEGGRATSLITHAPHCTPTDLTPLKHIPKNQYSCECTPTHTLKDRSQRTSTCELMNIWMQRKCESEGAAESSLSNGIRDWVGPGGIHGEHQSVSDGCSCEPPDSPLACVCMWWCHGDLLQVSACASAEMFPPKDPDRYTEGTSPYAGSRQTISMRLSYDTLAHNSLLVPWFSYKSTLFFLKQYVSQLMIK